MVTASAPAPASGSAPVPGGSAPAAPPPLARRPDRIDAPRPAGSASDPALDAALAELVAVGVLDEGQARAVRSARLAQAAALPTAAAPATSGFQSQPQDQARGDTTTGPRPNPLPEILGYAGAALVGSAALTLLLQAWDAWSFPTRLGVAAGATAALVAAGVIVLAVSGGRSAVAAGSPGRRRLVALLLALAVPLAGLTTVLAFDTAGIHDSPVAAVVAGAVALVVAAAAAWAVRAVLTTLAVALGTGWLALAAGAWIWPDAVWMAPVAVVVVAAAWLALAPRLLAVPALSEALGWGGALLTLISYALWSPPPDAAWMSQAGQLAVEAARVAAWTARGLLVALAIAGAMVFLRGGRWPWAAGSVAAAVLAAVSIAGQALTWILALLVAGIVLLAVSAGLVVLRRRNRTVTSDPERSLPAGPGR